jgi:hypothetical protein
MRDEVLSLRDIVDAADAGYRFLQSGAVRISSNEWKKARHFGDRFWLYVVTGAKTEAPELHRIPNPAALFRMEEEIRVTGYIIHEDAWRGRVEN